MARGFLARWAMDWGFGPGVGVRAAAPHFIASPRFRRGRSRSKRRPRRSEGTTATRAVADDARPIITLVATIMGHAEDSRSRHGRMANGVASVGAERQIASGMSAKLSEMSHAHAMQRFVVELREDMGRTYLVHVQQHAQKANEMRRQISDCEHPQGLFLRQEATECRAGFETKQQYATGKDKPLAPQADSQNNRLKSK